MRIPSSSKPIPEPPLLADCLAKSVTQSDGSVVPGATVVEHCLATGYLAGLLAVLYPSWLRALFLTDGIELLAALHDVGKVCPTFQEKIRRALSGYIPCSFPGLTAACLADDPTDEKSWGGHATISGVTVTGMGQKQCGRIIAKHHGRLFERFGDYPSDAESFGGTAWLKRRHECVEIMQRHFACSWPRITSQAHAEAVAGLVCLADWIASGEDLRVTESTTPEQARAICAEALARTGFVEPALVEGLSFKDIFGFDPNPMQQRLTEACTGPGVYVLEAPMGGGKTEAALYAAYCLMSRGICNGLYFALPTRTTSDKIHQRIDPFLERIVQPESPHRHSLLLHGQALLQESALGVEGEPGQSWFNSLKRAILAPFGVGTIDQALIGALPDARHSFMRTFGLLGKVVVLDEVHSYDTYTFSIIKKFLENMRRLGSTVIVLSATLTLEKRTELLGLNQPSMAYPLISSAVYTPSEMGVDAADGAASGILSGIIPETDSLNREWSFPAAAEKTVRLHLATDAEQVMEEVLDRAEQGEQVLWIENTVREAQERYRKLRARDADVDCGLIHSRFIQRQRAELEENWTRIYGKDGGEERSRHGRILVGTQVLEQSLDIDADCLVSALCPMDMLLQRMGRLWRHEADTKFPRPPGAQRQTFVLLPKDSQTRQDMFGPSGKVYAPYILLRTMRLLHNLEEVRLPADIRDLLEKVYEDLPEEGQAKKFKSEWLDKARLLKAKAGYALAELGQGMDDEHLGTRYSEEPSVTLLPVKALRLDDNVLHLTLLDGQTLALARDATFSERRRQATTLMRHVFGVSRSIAPQGALPASMTAILRRYVYFGGKGEADPLFRVVLTDASGRLSNYDGSLSERYEYSYTATLGFYSTNLEKEHIYG